MSMENFTSLAVLWSSESPVLPEAWIMQAWLCLGWSVVLCWALAMCTGAWPARWRLGLLGLVALWCWWPGPYSPPYWLGLAFQSPAITTVLLSGMLLYAQWTSVPRQADAARSGGLAGVWVLVVPAIVLGWMLLLDTLAMLPFALYPLGFSPAATGVAMSVGLLPWVVQRGDESMGAMRWLTPAAVLLFVVLRVPGGNLWDALLDPWLWLALQVYAGRAVWRRIRS